MKKIFSLIFILASITVFSQNEKLEESILECRYLDTMSKVNSVLERIMNKDQDLRHKLDYAFENSGHNSPEYNTATENMNLSDSINQKQIESIFNKYGWLYPPDVSEKASKAYFYVIQHATYEFMKKYNADVDKAFEKGVLDIQEYEFFIDRLAIKEQRYQKYGTQKLRDNIGNNYFVPIDTTKNTAINIQSEKKESDFILFSNHNFVALFIHSFYIETNKPSPHKHIYLDNKIIGETNSEGFFQTLIPRKKEESTLMIVDQNSKKEQIVKLVYQEQIDFFDKYFGYR